MTTWDTSTPLGSDPMSTVDDKIRETKTAIQEALRAQASSGTEAIFPGADTSNPLYRYRGLKGSTAARPAATDGGLYFNTTKSTIQRANGTDWEDGATLFPAGTVMGFFQASVPVGWTQVTSHNDKALRVVSGTGGGSGGTHDLSSPPSTAHTHSVSMDTGGSHFHNLHVHSSGQTGGAANAIGYSPTQGGDALVSITTGGFSDYSTVDRYTTTDGGHTHTINETSTGPTAFAPKYVDIVLGSKD